MYIRMNSNRGTEWNSYYSIEVGEVYEQLTTPREWTETSTSLYLPQLLHSFQRQPSLFLPLTYLYKNTFGELFFPSLIPYLYGTHGQNNE